MARSRVPFRAPLVTVFAAFAPAACATTDVDPPTVGEPAAEEPDEQEGSNQQGERKRELEPDAAGEVGSEGVVKTCPSTAPAAGTSCRGGLVCNYEPCRVVMPGDWYFVSLRCEDGRFVPLPASCNPPRFDAGAGPDAQVGDAGRFVCPAVPPEPQQPCSGEVSCDYDPCPYGGFATKLVRCVDRKIKHIISSCNPPAPIFDGGRDLLRDGEFDAAKRDGGPGVRN